MVAPLENKAKKLIPAYRHINDMKQIIRLEGRGNYSLIYVKNETNPLMVSRSLKYFEERFTGFIRISKSSLINPSYVKRVTQNSTKTLTLLLKDGTKLPASRRRVGHTLARLGKTPILSPHQLLFATDL